MGELKSKSLAKKLARKTAKRMLKDAKENPAYMPGCRHRPHHDLSIMLEPYAEYNQALIDFWRSRI